MKNDINAIGVEIRILVSIVYCPFKFDIDWIFRLDPEPRSDIVLNTCYDSSKNGYMITAWRPFGFKFCNKGKLNEIVLPLPVGAVTNTFLFYKSNGILCICTAVGLVKP